MCAAKDKEHTTALKATTSYEHVGKKWTVQAFDLELDWTWDFGLKCQTSHTKKPVYWLVSLIFRWWNHEIPTFAACFPWKNRKSPHFFEQNATRISLGRFLFVELFLLYLRWFLQKAIQLHEILIWLAAVVRLEGPELNAILELLMSLLKTSEFSNTYLKRLFGCFQNRGTPKWMVYNGKPENPIKMDDLGVPLFLETPICYPAMNHSSALFCLCGSTPSRPSEAWFR